MSAVMANCIRRSNAVAGYSAKVTYRESVVYASFFAGELYSSKKADVDEFTALR
jgi:hypothetical protein